jgi:hypothetical protein
MTPAGRGRVAFAIIALLILGMSTLHVVDARRKGEAVWPVIVGVAVVALALAGVVAFLRRPVVGLAPAEATRVRARQLVRWAAPIAIALALLAALAQAILAPS